MIKSSFRRSTASATAPPTSERNNSGTSSNRAVSPTASVEPVIRYTWYGIATKVSWVPMYETPDPIHKSR